jgi:hypothetical protein
VATAADDLILPALVATSAAYVAVGDEKPGERSVVDDPAGDPLPAEEQATSPGTTRRSRSRTAVPV